MNSLAERLAAAANGSRGWRADLLREAAKAMEARRATTGTGVVHDSAVPVGDLPERNRLNPQDQSHDINPD